MSVQQSIEKKILDELAPVHLEVSNESHKHSVPENSETHFLVVVVSEKFAGLKLIERQRKVNTLLEDELKGPVHALSQRTFTPQEWETRGQKAGTGSPNCGGGHNS